MAERVECLYRVCRTGNYENRMGEPGGGDAIPLYHGWAGGQGQAVSEEYPDCTFVEADEQGLFECQENWPP